jgi:hypothetical protein
MWPALGAARDGTPPPTQPNYETGSRPKQQACHQPAHGALPPIRLPGVWGQSPQGKHATQAAARKPTTNKTANN